METASERPSLIKNKLKREEVYAKLKQKKRKEHKEKRRKRKREVEELGPDAPPVQKPRTIEAKRLPEETFVEEHDEEVAADEGEDEFAAYYAGTLDPKLMITTRPRPSRQLHDFVGELLDIFPNSYYYKRGTFNLKEICQYATNSKFTHLIVLSEKSKVCNGMIISHLPTGPTAFFKVSSFVAGRHIKGSGERTAHVPELILNNFNTRLGHRVGRFLGSLLPHKPELQGRNVVTFHNQRDFVFFRYHRYMFEDAREAALEELGPQFTLKLRWLQVGTFDTLHGEYEWVHKRKEMDVARAKFHI